MPATVTAARPETASPKLLQLQLLSPATGVVAMRSSSLKAKAMTMTMDHHGSYGSTIPSIFRSASSSRSSPKSPLPEVPASDREDDNKDREMSAASSNKKKDAVICGARIVGIEESSYVIVLRSLNLGSGYAHVAIARSFEEFSEMHQELLWLAKSDRVVATLITSGSLALPRRRMFVTRAVMEERSALLELYVKELLRLPQSLLAGNPTCVKFLTPSGQDLVATAKWHAMGLASFFGADEGVFKESTQQSPKLPLILKTVSGLDEDWLAPVEERRRSRAVSPLELKTAMQLSSSQSMSARTPISSRQSSLPNATLHQIISAIYEEAAKSSSGRESFVERNFAIASAAVEADFRSSAAASSGSTAAAAAAEEDDTVVKTPPSPSESIHDNPFAEVTKRLERESTKKFSFESASGSDEVRDRSNRTSPKASIDRPPLKKKSSEDGTGLRQKRSFTSLIKDTFKNLRQRRSSESVATLTLPRTPPASPVPAPMSVSPVSDTTLSVDIEKRQNSASPFRSLSVRRRSSALAAATDDASTEEVGAKQASSSDPFPPSSAAVPSNDPEPATQQSNFFRTLSLRRRNTSKLEKESSKDDSEAVSSAAAAESDKNSSGSGAATAVAVTNTFLPRTAAPDSSAVPPWNRVPEKSAEQQQAQQGIFRSLSMRMRSLSNRSDDGPPQDTVVPVAVISGPTDIEPWTDERGWTVPVRSLSLRGRQHQRILDAAAGIPAASFSSLPRSHSLGRIHRPDPLEIEEDKDDVPIAPSAGARTRVHDLDQVRSRRRGSFLPRRSHSLSDLSREGIEERFVRIRCNLPGDEALSLKISLNTSLAAFKRKVEGKTGGRGWGSAVSSLMYSDAEGSRVVVVDEEDWEALIGECSTRGAGRGIVTVRFS